MPAYWVLAGAGLIWTAAAVVFPFSLFFDPSTMPAPRADLLAAGLRLNRLAMVVLGLALAGTSALLLRARPVHELPVHEGLSAREPKRTALAALLLLALGLRLFHSGSGLWYDEVVTLVDYVRLSFPDLLTTYAYTNNHPLYSILAKGSTELLGESAWSLRLPAVLAGVLSIWALYWLSAKVVDYRQAFLATALMAVSYHHVWFSQNARGYTGLLAVILVATGLFLDGLRERRRGLWLFYALVVAAGMYMHLSAGMVFLGHGLIYAVLLGCCKLARSGRGFRSRYPGACEYWPLLGFGLALLMTFQLYAIILPQVWAAIAAQGGASAVTAGAGVQSWKNPIWTAAELLRGFDLGPLGMAVLFGIAGLLALGLLRLLRTEPVLAVLTVIAPVITLAVLLVARVNLWPRYFFAYAGFAILAAVMGAFVAGTFIAERFGLQAGLTARRAGSVIASLLIVASAATLPRNYRLPKQDFAGARDYVESARDAEDSVFTLGLMTSLPYDRLYAPRWDSIEDVTGLDAAIASHGRVWLVYAFPSYVSSVYGDVMARVQLEFDLMREFPGTVGGGTLYVLRSR